MKKKLTLHEKFARMQLEEWLKKTTIPMTLDELEKAMEKEKEVPPTLDELQQRVAKVIEDAEQFFARFGLTSDKHEALFQMPIIQQCLDEIMAGVSRERKELELTIGRPRNGWDLLPFEKLAETEKILQKLPEEIRTEKIKEISLDEVFDRSAQAQIEAIQKRLSEALKDVKKAVDAQKKAMTLPTLPLPLLSSSPKHEPLDRVTSAIALSDLQEKRPINIDFERRYAEQLKIVMPQNTSTTAASNLSLQQETASIANENFSNLIAPEENINGKSSRDKEIREVAAIRADIEKMTAKKQDALDFSPSVAIFEDEPLQKIEQEVVRSVKKSSRIGTNQSIVISALKSRMQHGNNEQPAIIEENIDGNEQQEKSLMNLFTGVTLPGLPFSGEQSQNNNTTTNVDNQSKTLAAHRRQTWPRRFQL
ncbi:MAG: hypothetical protein LBS71_00075 [Puniceicoccales bacterium]|jgi:hypothetical protein|nr:hypothetical protein [Puniceicoccales bacterium]